MKNEMDLLGMNPLERWAWLMANRLTLIGVGLVWLGMILHQLTLHQTPWFLMLMVPLFAAIRLAGYLFYRKRLS